MERFTTFSGGSGGSTTMAIDILEMLCVSLVQGALEALMFFCLSMALEVSKMF